MQICIYDDRPEVTSPGELERGLLLTDALAGQSEIRNNALAQAFRYMKLIENWGTGLLRVQREVLEFGLRPPEFVICDNMFCVSIYRMSLEEFGEKLHSSVSVAPAKQQEATSEPEPVKQQQKIGFCHCWVWTRA